jgi:cholest-4-en-3-one 26-monooxygenase
MRLEDIDLQNPGSFVQSVPHDVFRFLRAEAPVARIEERMGSGFMKDQKGRGFWAVTQYQDVVTVSKDPGRFSSWRGGTNIEDFPEEDLSLIRLIMLNMDPPQHGKFRKLVSLGFTPRVISFLEPRIRMVTNQILDGIAKRGECDFVTSVAAELPLQVIAELIGIPMEDRHKVFDWSNRLIGFDDPDFATSPEDGKMAAMEVWMYANSLAEQRKDGDGGDFVSILMNAEVDGERLSTEEFDSFFLVLAVAGNETTRNLISGGMQALIEHPEQRKRLIDDPSLIPSGVEEMLRWVSPVMNFRRTATRDTELHGQKIKENDKVVIYYSSANRDEAVFKSPEVFDVGRTPNEHLAFGVGEHFCLGSSLARLEIRVIFEELLRRFPDMELAGPVARLRSNFLNGIKRMPVKFTPEK